MSTPFSRPELNNQLAEALESLAERVRRSLVIVQNGRRGAGAGTIWRQNGAILTNNHVILGSHLRVIMEGGSELPAEVLDRDPEVDLALLKVDAKGLPVASVADSRNVRVGELAFAVGHPWGQRNVVTMGVISGLGYAETQGRRQLVPILRSDVLLAPGNSGGPLVNASGGVIGINAMIVGGDQSVAIPSQVASDFVFTTLDRQVALGVSIQTTRLPATAMADTGGSQVTGLMVIGLTPGGSAERAGLIPGDILVECDGVALDGPRNLLRALTARRPGERVPLTLLRGGHLKRLEAELDQSERRM